MKDLRNLIIGSAVGFALGMTGLAYAVDWIPGVPPLVIQSLNDGTLLDDVDADFDNIEIDGTAITATAAELNYNAGVTPGTVTASKTLMVGANKNLDTLAIADGGLALGSGAGTAVTSTAAELNKLDGTAAGLSAAELSILDGVTATAAELNLTDNTVQAMAPGTGADGSDAYGGGAILNGTLFTTRIVIDVDGLNAGATAADVIGDDAAANANIGQITAALNGTIVGGYIRCLQAPAGGDTDIDLYSVDESSLAEDAAISGGSNGVQLINHGAWSANEVDEITGVPVANQYLYLVGQDGGNATYTAGIFEIVLFGV